MQFCWSSTRTVRDSVVTNEWRQLLRDLSAKDRAPGLLELEDQSRLVLGDVNQVLHIEDLLAHNLLVVLLHVRLIDNDQRLPEHDRSIRAIQVAAGDVRNRHLVVLDHLVLELFICHLAEVHWPLQHQPDVLWRYRLVHDIVAEVLRKVKRL